MSYLDFDSIDCMPIPELERLKNDLEIDIARIKTQVAEAKAAAAAHGDYSDNKWFISATHALRMKGVAHQKILMVLSQKKKDAKRQIGGIRDRLFIQVAKKVLEPDLYSALWDEVHAASRVELSNPTDQPATPNQP